MSNPLPATIPPPTARLHENMALPPSRAKSCITCRRSKVKCRGPPGGPPFPCQRCQRLKIDCTDPQLAESRTEDACTGLHNLSRLMAKRLSSPSQPPINRERIRRLLDMFTLLYRRRVLSGLNQHDSPLGLHLKDMVRVLAVPLGFDADSYMAELTSLDGSETAVVIDGHYLTHQGPRGQALHPYVAAIFDETRSTLAIVNIRGHDRFYCNDSFSRTFFTEEEAQQMYNHQELPVPTILAIPIHRDEKSRFDRAVKRIMLEAPAACAETTQMYRLRLPKLGASVMALMRTRFVIVEEGSYLAAVFSFAPLPIHAGATRRGPQGDRRSTLQCSGADAEMWLECANEFGEFEEPRGQEAGGASLETSMEQGSTEEASAAPKGLEEAGSFMAGGGQEAPRRVEAPRPIIVTGLPPTDAGSAAPPARPLKRALECTDSGKPPAIAPGPASAPAVLQAEDLMVLSEILWDTAQPPQYYQQQFLQQAQGTPQVHVQPAQGYPMPPPYATAGYAGATAWFHAGPTNPI